MNNPADEALHEPSLPLKAGDPVWFAEALICHRALRRFYDEKGIRCFGCNAAEAETFEQGAKVHESGGLGGFDAKALVAELNELARKNPYREETEYDPSLLRKLINLIFPSSTEAEDDAS